MLTRHIPPSITIWSRRRSSANPAKVPWLWWGERSHPVLVVFSSPLELEDGRTEGADPTVGPSPGYPGHHLADVSMWANQHPTSHGPSQRNPVLGNGGQHGPLPSSGWEAGHAGTWPPHQPPWGWWRQRGASKGGVLLRRAPAGKPGSALCGPQLIWPGSSLTLRRVSGGLLKCGLSLSSLVHSPAHAATQPGRQPNMTPEKKKRSQL